ncbi:MAG: CBS domain-containing protein [Ardenticatenaceae bacterium]|nr:CBS domain-containing protein [Ardenticatenaceae bacterium]MCB8987937.1 CBS domain-containing protein [Ardenticatenaceae bacterium]
MTTINQILQNKEKQVWTVTPEATVFEALELLADKNIGAAPVVEDGRLVGIFSERDYARKVILHGRSSRHTPVRDVMTGQVFTIRPQEDMNRCMSLMTDKHIRHLPVLDNDEQLIGIISIGDVVKAIIAEQQVLIDHLQDYITGAHG